MKKEEFLQEVMHELECIKQKATKEEISKLDIKQFDHLSGGCCIYGQMTGGCATSRAEEIMPKTYNNLPWLNYKAFSNQSMKKGNRFTALEKYLFMVKKEKHKELIEFLKGERKEIEL